MKTKTELENRIFELCRDIEIHQSIEIMLADKNKKYVDTLKSLTEKVTNLTNKLEKFEDGEPVSIAEDSSLNKIYNDIVNENPSFSQHYSKSNKSSFINSKDLNNSKIPIRENSYSLSKSKEIYQGIKDYQMSLSLQKKLENLRREFEQKQKDYEILKLKFENVQEGVKEFQRKASNLYGLFETGLNEIAESSEVLNEEDLEFDIEKVKNWDFEELTREQKFSLLTVLLKKVAPFLNLGNIRGNSLSVSSSQNNLHKNVNLKYHFHKNYKEIDLMEKKIKIAKNNRSSSGLHEATHPRIKLPKLERKDPRFTIPLKLTVINNPSLIN
jgi:hypothetical protein